jgi:signal peptidase I
MIKKIIGLVMDALETIVFAASLIVVVYLFVGFPTSVIGASMEPNFHTGDRVFTSRISYKLGGPKRGDVVVVKSPLNPDIELIKRVVGLSGDKIAIKQGVVYINDEPLAEGYLTVETNARPAGFIKEEEVFVVPEDYIFIMGDNRPRSSDSREFGPVPLSGIVGKVVYRYFPWSKVGQLRNPYSD